MNADRVARVDHAHCLPPLFRSLLRMKERPKLDLAYRFGPAELHWRGPDQLDIADQAVFLALIALAWARPSTSEPGVVRALPRGLYHALQPTGDVEGAAAVFAITTWTELARWSGHSDRSAATLQQMRAAVRRLTEVTVWVSEHGREYSTRLIAHVVTDERQVAFALNPRLADAVGGRQFAAILLSERYALRSDIAKALHTFLSSTLRPGNRFRHGLARLEAHVWGDQAVAGTRRSRHRRLRQALCELVDTLGWGVSWYDSIAEISRPDTSIVGVTGTLRRGNGNGTSGKRERLPAPQSSTGAGSAASANAVQGSTRTYNEPRRRRADAPADLVPGHAPPHGGGEGVPQKC